VIAKHVARATKAANNSTFKYKLGAVIVKSGRILSCANNKVGEHSQHVHFPFPGSIHAEQSAIIKLLQRRELNSLIGSTMYVSRITNKGETAMAKPCQHCLEAIKAVGIKRVIYTSGPNSTEILNIRNM